MQVTLRTWGELSPQDLTAWRQVQQSNAVYDSPFFCPEFAGLVDAVRGRVEVGVLAEANRTVGFFPFERRRGQTAEPVGGMFSEAHGVLIEPRVDCDHGQILQDCGLKKWAFHHLPVALGQFAVAHYAVGQSPFMDLSQGFDAFCEAKSQQGSGIVGKTRRLTRKLERDLGPVRLVVDDDSGEGMDCLLRWKSAQHDRTGVPDVFRLDWVRALLARVATLREPTCRGTMSVLYAGERPVAVHLGMQTESSAHAWYPAFDRDFARYSPGLVLFMELAKALAARGVRRLEFGPGDQPYKRRLCTSSHDVARGIAGQSAVSRSLGVVASSAQRWLRTSRVRQPLQTLAATLRPHTPAALGD